ncbi:hypothetical protein MKW94_013145 [Papaver nudicaule]|uniref:Peroxidase n=1 Tax=Papaver nudicaule TaxID=74823 RepID=A0AA41V6K4_PAPNU|nr:hypothetical protein [Papaver nudicaule]
MEVGAMIPTTIVGLFLFCLILGQSTMALSQGLQYGFYNDVCPEAEQIVNEVVSKFMHRDANAAAGLIRLHFHDCFVNGCDASVLLEKTPSGEPVEKDSPANYKSLRGMDIIDKIKEKLEDKCPGIVSCADILAFAARDAAVNAGVLPYLVPGGRRDGSTSRAVDTMILPGPFLTVEELTDTFAKKGLTQDEMVILSGAHSIGSAHCGTFGYRLYGEKPHYSQDPSLEPMQAEFLKTECPPSSIPKDGSLGRHKVPLDSITPTILDNMYYAGLLQGKGLLASDQGLMKNFHTRNLVIAFALNPIAWSRHFGLAMEKMGNLDVLTGDKGEIRRKCRRIN